MKQTFKSGSLRQEGQQLQALQDIRELLYLLATQSQLETRPIGWDERLEAFEDRRMI